MTAPRPENAYSHGWKVIKENFLPLLFLVGIFVVLESPVSYFQLEDVEFTFNGLEEGLYSAVTNLNAILYSVLIVVPIEFGIMYLFLKTVRGEPFDIKIILSPYNRFLDVIFAQILTVVIVGLGLIFLIVPGIIFMIRLSFVRYLVMDKRLKAMEAVKESWRMTDGYGWTIFGMGILAIFIFFGGVLFFIVGVFVSFMWINAAFASLYYAIDSKNNSESGQRQTEKPPEDNTE